MSITYQNTSYRNEHAAAVESAHDWATACGSCVFPHDEVAAPLAAELYEAHESGEWTLPFVDHGFYVGDALELLREAAKLDSE